MRKAFRGIIGRDKRRPQEASLSPESRSVSASATPTPSRPVSIAPSPSPVPEHAHEELQGGVTETRTEEESGVLSNGGPSEGAPPPEREEAPPAQEASSSAPEQPASNISDDLWAKAYDILTEREPDLISDYEKHLDGREDSEATSANSRPALSNPDAVKDIVQSLQDDRKAKQWKFNIRSKDHKVKDQLEKLVKLVSLADGIIKQAVSAQPYAALAWSGVSIFLPVCSMTNPKSIKGICNDYF